MKNAVIAVLIAVMALVGGVGVVDAGNFVDAKISIGAKQVSINEGDNQHLGVADIELSKSSDAIKLYGSFTGDFANENIDKLAGQKIELGVVNSFGDNCNLKISATSDKDFTGRDTETIAVMGSYKF